MVRFRPENKKLNGFREILLHISKRVDDLVKKRGGRELFEEKLEVWSKNNQAQRKKYQTWLESREDYFKNIVCSYKALQKKKSKPPKKPSQYKKVKSVKDSWVWDVFEDSNPNSDDVIKIEGWTPVDLSRNSRPKPGGLPVPMGDRQLTLPEKFILLAALHDSVLPNLSPINPWRNDVSYTSAEFDPRTTYIAFVRDIENLIHLDFYYEPQKTKITLNHFIKEVEQLLPQDEQNKIPQKKKNNKRGRPKKYSQEELERMEKAFNQNINKGLTVKKAYNQVAKAFGLDSSRAVKQALYRHKKRNK